MANRDKLLPPYLVNTIRDDIPTPWSDMAEAIDSVFAGEVDAPRDFLARLRYVYLQNATTSAKRDARGLIDFDDFDTPEKSILVAAVNLLGQEFSDNSFVTQSDFLRLYRNLATFWYEKGKFNFIDFIGFLLNAQLNMYHLWSGRDKYVTLTSGNITSPSRIISGDATHQLDFELTTYTGSTQWLWACDTAGTEHGRELYVDTSGNLYAKWKGRYANLLAASENFTSGTWVKTLLAPNVTVVGDNILAPDSTTTGDTLTQVDIYPTVLYQTITIDPSTNVYAGSVYLKHLTTAKTAVELIFGTQPPELLQVDWNTLTATGVGATVYGVTFSSEANGWRRLQFLARDLTGASTSLTFRIWPSGIGGAAGNVGAWGAMVSATEFVLPYSATTGSYTGSANLGALTGTRFGLRIEWVDADADGNGKITLYKATPAPTSVGLPLTYVQQSVYNNSGPLGVVDDVTASYKIKAAGKWYKASLFRGVGTVPVSVSVSNDSVTAISQIPEVTTGSLVTLTGYPSAASMPGGLAAGNYYAIQLSPFEFRLATSQANAEAGTYVNVTSAGAAQLSITSAKIVRPLVSEFQPRGVSATPVIDAVLDKNLNVWTLPTGTYSVTDSAYYPFKAYGTDVIGTPIWEGGNWFPTCHVRVSFDPSKFHGLSQTALKSFFYSFANYDLVLDSIDEEETIGIGAPAKELTYIVGQWFYEDEEEWPDQIGGPIGSNILLVGHVPTITV